MENVVLKKEDELGILYINRPNALNALNRQTLNDIRAAVEDIKGSSEIKCLIITGMGEKAFVAGADIAEMRNMNPSEAQEFSEFGNSVFAEIETLEIPVIAAVNGYALGGGCELALCCDIRIASENAVFGCPEVGLGIIPGFGGTQRLFRAIGVSRAKEMIYTGRNIKADEAYIIGLVNRIFPKEDILNEAMKFAGMITKNSSSAVKNSKLAINKGALSDIGESLKYESEIFRLCFENGDRERLMDAFLSKRK